MIYRKFQGKELSALGFGCMRLPVKGGVYADIDYDLAEKMIDYAYSHGVNYFDTAWGYHDGNSETAVGKILSKYPRDSFYLASKFPGYDLANMGKVKEIFEEQLKKCRVDYFDFYLIHNVCELNINEYLDEKYGTLDYLIEQKKAGRIKHLGFSGHGEIPVLRRFLDKYGKYMEFGQLQLNYVDWDFQSARGKVELLKERGIPIWVMEPLRGGKLAKLSEDDEKKLKSLRPDANIPSWAFRFLQTLPEVTVVLSGMSDMAQTVDNVNTFAEEKPLDKTELETLLQIGRAMTGKSLPCTACRYCTSHCPKGLNIPDIIRLYNEHCFTGDGGFIAPMALGAFDQDKLPSACIGCRSCEAVCPQNIKISEMMKDFTSRL